MNFSVTTNKYMNIDNIEINNKLKELNMLFLEEQLKGNKVAYLYEDVKGENSFSFNKEICFYAASSIKILVCLIILEKAEKNEIDLEEKILITKQDLKQDTGIIKYQKQDTYYTIKKLIELTITESDNTAYLKLVSIIGKSKIKEYGNNLGATHTMEGKGTDSFGLINCTDMLVYWKKTRQYIQSNTKFSKEFKNYLLNPTVKIIKEENIGNKSFVRKYGSWDIAYHEAGYIEGKSPYYLIILTQLNRFNYKEEFINRSAKLLNEINNIIMQRR